MDLPADYKPFGYIDVMSNDGIKVDSTYEIGKTWITIGYDPGNEIRIKDLRQVDTIHCGIKIVLSNSTECPQVFLRLLTKKKSCSVSGLGFEPGQTQVQLNPSNATFSIGTRQLKWRIFSENGNVPVFAKTNGITQLVPGLLKPLVKQTYFTRNSETSLRIDVLKKAYESSMISQKKARKFTSEKKPDFGVILTSPEFEKKPRTRSRKPKTSQTVPTNKEIKRPKAKHAKKETIADNVDSKLYSAPADNVPLLNSEDYVSNFQEQPDFNISDKENGAALANSEASFQSDNFIPNDLKERLAETSSCANATPVNESNEISKPQVLFQPTYQSFETDEVLPCMPETPPPEPVCFEEVCTSTDEATEKDQFVIEETNQEESKALLEEEDTKASLHVESRTMLSLQVTTMHDKVVGTSTNGSTDSYSDASGINKMNTLCLENNPLSKFESQLNKSVPYADYWNWIQRFDNENKTSDGQIFPYSDSRATDINYNLSKFVVNSGSEKRSLLSNTTVKRKGQNICLAQEIETYTDTHTVDISSVGGPLSDLEKNECGLSNKIRKIDSNE